ncbi:hypothetical protein ABZP36_032370 [Zizania latifolia]
MSHWAHHTERKEILLPAGLGSVRAPRLAAAASPAGNWRRVAAGDRRLLVVYRSRVGWNGCRAWRLARWKLWWCFPSQRPDPPFTTCSAKCAPNEAFEVSYVLCVAMLGLGELCACGVVFASLIPGLGFLESVWMCWWEKHPVPSFVGV